MRKFVKRNQTITNLSEKRQTNKKKKKFIPRPGIWITDNSHTLRLIEPHFPFLFLLIFFFVFFLRSAFFSRAPDFSNLDLFRKRANPSLTSGVSIVTRHIINHFSLSFRIVLNLNYCEKNDSLLVRHFSSVKNENFLHENFPLYNFSSYIYI